VRAARIGAGDQDEVGIGLVPRLCRRAVLAHGLVDRDDPPAGHVPAALGDDLVLDMDAGDARAHVFPDRADHVDRIAVAVVGVRDDGYGDGARDVAGVQVHLGHRGEARVGHPEERQRRAIARHVHRGKSHLGEDARGQRVIAAGHHE
jgi:hypothetical protein